jgi:hypothetical protein
MDRKVLGLLLCLGGAVLAPDPAHSTSVLPMSLGQLIDQAQLVFSGEAVHREVVLSQDGSFPFTFVTFRVHEVLKGRYGDGEITLRLDGGETGREKVVVDGMPEFAVGDSYVLFLYGNGSVGCPVLGWWQGQLRFAREPRSGRNLLLDYRGVPIVGIAGGEWVRDLPEAADPAAPGAEKRGAALIEQDGVEISAWPPAGRDALKRRGTQAPEAESVIAALRLQIAQRSRLKSFVVPRPVETALPSEVPLRMSGDIVSPRR